MRDPDMKENDEVVEQQDGDQVIGEGESERVTALEQELQEARDQILRRTAEMDNMRRRFQSERELLIFEGNKRLITELLPVIDDLERTLQHAEKNSFAEGVELVYKNFLRVLQRYGIRPMETVGKPFDVHSHDALMEEVNAEVAPGTVTKEIQRGYMMNDSVLRHAKVIVAKQPDA
jgi:molecular chaperone GrpE